MSLGRIAARYWRPRMTNIAIPTRSAFCTSVFWNKAEKCYGIGVKQHELISLLNAAIWRKTKAAPLPEYAAIMMIQGFIQMIDAEIVSKSDFLRDNEHLVEKSEEEALKLERLWRIKLGLSDGA